MIPPSLEARYNRLALTPSSINEHMPLLREMAYNCVSIAEFGVDIGQSTTAFLMGRPGCLHSYDLVSHPGLDDLLEMVPPAPSPQGDQRPFGATSWFFTLADTRTLTLPHPMDLLLIDSAHYYAQTLTELTRHHSLVRHRIVLHDTVSFGTHGEGGEPGILGAIEDFQRSHPEWSIEAHYLTNNGLMILRRTP